MVFFCFYPPPRVVFASFGIWRERVFVCAARSEGAVTCGGLWEGQTIDAGGGVKLMPVPPWNFSSSEKMLPSYLTVMDGFNEYILPPSSRIAITLAGDFLGAAHDAGEAHVYIVSRIQSIKSA